MGKETIDTAHEVVYKKDRYEIVRSECRNYNSLTGKTSGRKMIFYDVCDQEDCLASFKTLAKAKSYIKDHDIK